MPRMFWKLFFALWLSIMSFAVVVAWINQTVILQNTMNEPGEALPVNLQRIEKRLSRDLERGGERQLRRGLAGLHQGLRNHVFILDQQGRELLGRDRQLKRLQRNNVRSDQKVLEAGDGKRYTLIRVDRPPPRSLMAPGPRGVGMRLIVAAAISALVSLLLARYLAAPLAQLSHASRLLAKGDLSVRVGGPMDKRRDEFGQLARDMDEMAARLQTSQQANRRLLRDVSHELRSPLARLRVALEIARNKDQRLVVEELNRIELESERLEKLVDEVLALLRESSGSSGLNIERFDLAGLLEDLVGTVSYEIADSSQKIQLEQSPSLILDADRELLWRTFENLIRNAMVHTGEDGTIRVSACRSDKETIEVRVTDTGPGIPRQHIDRIFEPFYRVDEARDRQSGGHGLGLAIAASAVRRHGGNISASNRTGAGLEVKVSLPANDSGPLKGESDHLG